MDMKDPANSDHGTYRGVDLTALNPPDLYAGHMGLKGKLILRDALSDSLTLDTLPDGLDMQALRVRFHRPKVTGAKKFIASYMRRSNYSCIFGTSMRMIVLLLTMTISFSPVYSQNLVLNPSFEDTLQDWSDWTHYALCEHWYNPNGMTADYFSPYCGLPNWDNWGWYMMPPNTFIGYQNAQEGSAFIGLVLWEPNGHPTKEYAQGELSGPLIEGQQYFVALHVSLANTSDYSTCEIDLAFSPTRIFSSTGGSLNFTDTVKFNITLVDTANWTLVEGTYTAKGGEKYVFIGSNRPNSQLLSCIDTMPTDEVNYQSAYYFIDNVYVSTEPLAIDRRQLNYLNLFPNPAANFIVVTSNFLPCQYRIVDLTGKSVQAGILSVNREPISLSNLANGIYIFKTSTHQPIKLIVEH